MKTPVIGVLLKNYHQLITLDTKTLAVLSEIMIIPGSATQIDDCSDSSTVLLPNQDKEREEKRL